MSPSYGSLASLLTKIADPVREPFINQVPLPDDVNDAKRRRCLLPKLFSVLAFFFPSDDELDLDGGATEGS